MPSTPPSLTRRRVLGGCVTFSVLAAGCVGAATHDDPSRTPADAPTDDAPTEDAPTDSSPPVERGTVSAFDPTDTVDAVDVGTPSEAYEPHVLDVWNDADAARDVAVGVVDDATGEAMVDETFSLPPHAAVELRLRERSRYVYEVRVPASGRGRRLSVPLSLFDCNRSRTNVAVRADGEIAAVVVSTAMARTTTAST